MGKALNQFLLTVLLATGISPHSFAVNEQINLLSEALEEESVTWLQANGEKFLALWEPDSSGNSYGAILLLHGAGQTVDWPDTINPIRTSLIQFGWSTLSISLPNPDIQNGEEMAKNRIEAALQFLDQKGQLNLVILGQGVSANRGFEYLKNIPASPTTTRKTNQIPPTRGPFRALIMISARDVAVTRNFKLPTLDLYYDEHYLDDTEVKERLTLSRKYRLPYFHQIRMVHPEETQYGEENRLTRRIRGFLNKYARGVEVQR